MIAPMAVGHWKTCKGLSLERTFKPKLQNLMTYAESAHGESKLDVG